MRVLRTLRELKAWRASLKAPLALVPTMGHLHAGHAALICEARARAGSTRAAGGEAKADVRADAMADAPGGVMGEVLVTIFVNPMQFAAHEDLARYPRSEPQDLQLCAQQGATAVWLPTERDLYPHGTEAHARVRIPGFADLEGAHRPGHFEGVATVVLKLLLLSQPRWACFGEKDFQQLRLVEALVRDFELPLTVVPVQTVRDGQGLALSSRNDYLTPERRQHAARLFAVLGAMTGRLHGGEPIAAVQQAGLARLEADGFDVDYLELRDAQTLAPLPPSAELPSGVPARLMVAARLDGVRLLDNVAVLRRA